MGVKHDSIWGRYETLPLSPAFKNDTADIVVVGAGGAGLTAAYMLAQAGFRPPIIESEGIGAGMTGRSTAHISAAVDGGWRKMAKRLGIASARDLARAYRQGIEAVCDVAPVFPSSCDFT